MFAPDNAEAIEAWNTVLFEKFCRFRHLLTTGLAVHGLVALERTPPPPRGRVVDIGCGFGDTAVDIAARVGPEGHVVGIDAAANFVEEGKRTSAQAGAKNVAFEVGDVQYDPVGGPYDFAFSRFGTMFFANPVAAFRNVRKSLVPGGKLTIVVWRRREDNAWVHVAEERVRQIIPEPEKNDQVTCGPGPFSMASADTVSTQLVVAGYTEITFVRNDADICIGLDLDQAIDFAMAIGPAGEMLRLAGAMGEAHREDVVKSLRDGYAPFVRPDGVFVPSSAWLITATNPG